MNSSDVHRFLAEASFATTVQGKNANTKTQRSLTLVGARQKQSNSVGNFDFEIIRKKAEVHVRHANNIPPSPAGKRLIFRHYRTTDVDEVVIPHSNAYDAVILAFKFIIEVLLTLR